MDREEMYERALLDPEEVFESPSQVVRDGGLSVAQKIEVLRRWEYDVNELGVAEEEGMTGAAPKGLGQIQRALHALGESSDPDHTPPTKQKGR